MSVGPAFTSRFAVVATSFRSVGFGRLGAFVVSPEARDDLAALQSGFAAEELVFLSTCNRVECYMLLSEPSDGQSGRLLEAARLFFAQRGVSVDDATFFARTGREALEHLFTVSSSLDSLVVGETEISGQLRRATDRCRSLGLCGQQLEKMVTRSIACARRVRSETTVGSTAVSVATIALQKIRKHFGKGGPGVTVIVGVGDMSRKVAQALEGSTGKRIVVNRTRSKAEAFCERFGGVPMTIEELESNPPGWVDLVFTATSSAEAVITADHLRPALASRERAGVKRPLIVVDLGLPRDVDSAVDDLPGTAVVAMEHLEGLSRANKVVLDEEVARARAIVADEVSLVLREDHFRCLAGESTRAMLDSRLAHLSETDREAISRFVTGLAGRMARQPRDLAC